MTRFLQADIFQKNFLHHPSFLGKQKKYTHPAQHEHTCLYAPAPVTSEHLQDRRRGLVCEVYTLVEYRERIGRRDLSQDHAGFAVGRVACG